MSYLSSHAPSEAHPVPGPTLPIHDARRLTGDEGTAFIMLDGKTYTLRITRAGKLILTK
jgi:hemin uptake protein HemP